MSFSQLTLAQPVETFAQSIDPNPQNNSINDKGKNIWSIENHLYIVNGYINLNGKRSQQIIQIDANTRQIVKQIGIEGPQGDISISGPGGYCITADHHILLTGEWWDYIHSRIRTFIAKLDEDLGIAWINYYPDLTELNAYGDAITETPSGDILLYFIEGKPTLNEPWLNSESWVRVVKTDAAGNLLFNKIIPDTFSQTRGFGDLVRTEDGNYLLSTMVKGYYHHDIFGTYTINSILHKIDEDANPIWSRTINYCKFGRQGPVLAPLAGGGGTIMWERDTFISDPTIAPAFPEMHRFDENGHILWHHEWNDFVIRYVYRTITAANGDVLGLGSFKNYGKRKTWMFRIRPDGELLWERHYSDSIQRPWAPGLEMLDMCEMADGRLAATGIVFDSDSLGGINVNVGLLVLDSLGCLEPDCAGLTHYITGAFEPITQPITLPQLICSPNPASNLISVKLPTTLAHGFQAQTLRCYDIQGSEIAEIPWGNTEIEQQIEVQNWPPGAYYLIFWSGKSPLFSSKIIVQH